MTYAADKYDSIKRQMPEILNSTFGNVTTACKKAGISRECFYTWYNNDESFRLKCQDCKEIAKDFVESKLMKKINDEDTTAIIFYLKTQAKNRGYVERMETTGMNGGAIKQKIELDLTKEQIDALVRIGKGE